jgi:methylmalonyl-CoA mutase N-terminal domain/subunit
MRREIERSAYEAQQRLESGRDVAVGVNRFEEDEGVDVELFRIDPQEQDRIVAELRELRAGRDQAAVDRALNGLKRACDGTESLLPPILHCVETYATLGEICQTMEQVFGTY